MPRSPARPLSADWKRAQGSASVKHHLSNWRRKLPDGSYLTTKRVPGAVAGERYRWELRGPERDLGKGHKLVAGGISASSIGARRDADDYVAEHKGIGPVPVKTRA